VKVIAPVTRVLLGLIFSGFGLNGLLQIVPPPTAQGAAAVFMGGLTASRYFFPLFFITYLFAGAALLVGRFVPLALTVLAPIIVKILSAALICSILKSRDVPRGARDGPRNVPRLVLPRGISAAVACPL
jgi:hypothetical protein